MQNSSADNRERPTLPSIWDLFGDELSEPAGYSVRTSSPPAHTQSGQDRSYDGWVNHPAYQDHPSDPGLGPSPVPDIPGPTFHQSIPPPYYSQEVHQTHRDPSLHYNPGANVIIPPYQTNMHATPSGSGQSHLEGGFSQLTQLNTTSGVQLETNPGGSYDKFRIFQPLDTRDRDENAKYECQYCGKAFIRPSTLRIHLNSHTGQKPFVCPVEDCGRGFSVLSNMRRHARTHAQPTTREGGTSTHAQPSGTSAASNGMTFQKDYSDPSIDDF